MKERFLLSLPGLTQELITKHLPPSPATAKGYQKHRFKGIKSTKPATKNKPESEDQPIGNRSNEVTIKLDDLEKLTYSDQTGRFPVTRSRGFKQIMIMHDKDSNSILTEPLKSRKAT